jgi:hypothetical protein
MANTLLRLGEEEEEFELQTASAIFGDGRYLF